MTARTCRRCRGEEVDAAGLLCVRCDGYGIEPVMVPMNPEPGRDFIERAAAKASQARHEADTYHRSHWDGCHAAHLDCANREIARLRDALASGRATYADIHPEAGA